MKRPAPAVHKEIGVRLALHIGGWFVDHGLKPPIGGVDEGTGEPLAPRAADFAALAATNAAFAEVATM